MDVKLAAAVADPELNVRAWCRRHNISRSTFYKYKARFELEGLGGLDARSTRPRRSPSATSVDIEDAIVRARKELDDAGWDAGSDSIHARLSVELDPARVPSRATIWRVLGRRGLVTPQPSKRPRSSWRRFEWERPNDCWQIDATHWSLANGTVVEIINIIDDHSRVLIASRAITITTSANAWDTFITGASTWGLPAHVLSDNGLAFTSRSTKRDVAFAANLRTVGIKPITSSPYHPQTCGKVERFHQTLKKWLHRQDPAPNLRQLQALLDTFAEHYNTRRPHKACQRRPPIDKWRATPPGGPAGHPIEHPWTITTNTVSRQGRVDVNGYGIAVGNRWAGHTLTLIRQGNHVALFHRHDLVRRLELDTTRTYQALYPGTTGRPPDSVRDVSRLNGPR